MNKSLAIEKARSLKGAKWRHLGRKPWAIDCIGIIVLSLEAGGIIMNDRTNYGREPWNDGLENDLEAHFGKPFPVSEREAGDIVLMQEYAKKAPSHVGIITDTDSIIHSYSETGVVEHGVDDTWLSRMVCVYRPDWKLEEHNHGG